jgi:hypothetical protein
LRRLDLSRHATSNAPQHGFAGMTARREHEGAASYDLCAVQVVVLVDVHTGADPRRVYDPVPDAASNDENVPDTLRSVPDKIVNC